MSASLRRSVQLQWERAFADASDEAAGGPPGPCHGLGGAYHRCDGAPRWRSISYDGAPWVPHYFCDRAVVEARGLDGEKAAVLDGLHPAGQVASR